jgi:acyl-CoA synthetase (AMP-forming)/AMP-acid ligase II
MYGLTECKRTLYLPPEELDRRTGSVGIAIPGTEVWVEDEAGNRVAPGEVGELVVRGSHVMQGYWGKPEETARRYRPGRYPAERMLYTGDLFKMDEEGFLYFISRKDDIIKSRGEKVAPKEVESVLYQLPGIVEAAVVGVPDELLGQAIKAFVACGDDCHLTEQDVLRHCAQHLEDFMMPKYVEFRDSLPKTSSGKIQASALRDEVMRQP